MVVERGDGLPERASKAELVAGQAKCLDAAHDGCRAGSERFQAIDDACAFADQGFPFTAGPLGVFLAGTDETLSWYAQAAKW